MKAFFYSQTEGGVMEVTAYQIRKNPVTTGPQSPREDNGSAPAQEEDKGWVVTPGT